MEGSGSYRLKRGRDELSTPPASGNFPASDQRGTQNLLRCPWCPNGHLMRPAAKSPTNNSKEEGTHLCTNRSSCPCGAVIDQDRTMSFSCIDGSDLIRNFYNALDDHLETCQIVSQTPSQRDWAPWSIVAERSILFADPSNRKQRHSVDCSPPSLSPDPKGPVFYFLHCDNCGEKEFPPPHDSSLLAVVEGTMEHLCMLLLLEREHPAVHAAVERILRGDSKIPVSVVRDFDGCEYHIRVEWDKEEKEMSQTSGVDSKDTGSGEVGTVNVGGTASVTVSLRSFTPFAELNTHGNFYEVVTTLFPSELQKFVVCDTHKGDGEDFTVAVHIPSNVPAKMLREAMHSTAQLRAWSFVPAFARQFELFLTNPEVVQPLQLHYHDGEEMVVYNNRGSFIVAIALRVSSKDDAVLTRHFLQAMVEVRKHERSFCGSSAFIFEQGGPPDSVVAVTGPRGRVRDPNTFWCSFQLYKQQMEPPPRLVETVMHLVNFRTTLAYHIRAGRTYMHGIMRKRVESSLQWLNKAKARVAEETKITIT